MEGKAELRDYDPSDLDIADVAPAVVIGAGPVGLAVTVHLLAAGVRPVVLERGAEAATHVRSWAHVPMFSPWRTNIDAKAAELLRDAGWEAPPLEQLPTGQAFYELYLRPLAQTPQVRGCLRLNAQVTGVAKSAVAKTDAHSRQSSPFETRYIDGEGVERRIFSPFVIDASGTWGTPRPLGASGLPALGEAAAKGRISYGMPDILRADRARFAGRRVLVVGSGYSALGNLLSLAQLAETEPTTTVIWAMRTDRRNALSGGSNVLGQRAALGRDVMDLAAKGRFQVIAPFAVEAVQPHPSGALSVVGTEGLSRRAIVVDEIIASVGIRGDLEMLAELQLDLDPRFDCAPGIAQLIDPEIHTCGSVALHGAAELQLREANFFLAGIKSYGRTPTFLLANGYEQARSLAALVQREGVSARPVGSAPHVARPLQPAEPAE